MIIHRESRRNFRNYPLGIIVSSQIHVWILTWKIRQLFRAIPGGVPRGGRRRRGLRDRQTGRILTPKRFNVLPRSSVVFVGWYKKRFFLPPWGNKLDKKVGEIAPQLFRRCGNADVRMNCAKALIATLRKPPKLRLINAASYLSQLLGELENTLQVFNKGGKGPRFGHHISISLLSGWINTGNWAALGFTANGYLGNMYRDRLKGL